MMSHAEHAIAAPTEPLHRACHYPHYTFFMDYLGDVLLCPHDWGKRMIVGNMKKQDFMQIWTGKAFDFARRRLAAADRDFGPCRACDVKGTYMGAQHVEAWARLD
jgi:radical SAM protein with 4Fe4S-binding SPASM domain